MLSTSSHHYARKEVRRSSERTKNKQQDDIDYAVLTSVASCSAVLTLPAAASCAAVSSNSEA
jgi:hypothetical protein